ncbi:MAG: threonine synthase, partial [Alteromonadaceae bacterium]
PEAARKAGQASAPELPSHMSDLFSRDEKYTVLGNDVDKVRAFMVDNLTC